jgi:Ca2+/H+ antiporter, TMEM165/GDT1 family
MVSFYLTFLAVLLAGVGARDQVLIARMSQAQGRRVAVLLVGMLAAVATAAAAVWAAQAIGPLLHARARMFLAAIGLAFAGIELLVIRPGRILREPTFSLGALAIVVLFFQLIDAARFMVFAIAIATETALQPAIGGAVASVALVYAGWQIPDRVLGPWTLPLRRAVGGLLLLAGIVLGLRTLDMV